ncbi:MAG TPA: DUF1178 family protein [Stellaceae bacterium]|nr:DUF1178 family protein [Stellaceae bacterium]
MILFKLRCAAEHEFEAWFRDGATYERQAQRGLIACPDCASNIVEKAPMAPRLARSAAASEPKAPPSPDQLRRTLQQLRRQVETHCDYVGNRFAEEARRIHSGESEARSIYGEASEAEARALADDGIEVARIPWVPSSDA